jgi:hypothetical protein
LKYTVAINKKINVRADCFPNGSNRLDTCIENGILYPIKIYALPTTPRIEFKPFKPQGDGIASSRSELKRLHPLPVPAICIQLDPVARTTP